MPSPALARPAVRLVAAVLLALAAAGAAPQAEVEAPPPWPILLEGTALLDGAPAEGVLTAHIADWSSKPVPVADGRFGTPLDLIIGPPTGGLRRAERHVPAHRPLTAPSTSRRSPSRSPSSPSLRGTPPSSSSTRRNRPSRSPPFSSSSPP